MKRKYTVTLLAPAMALLLAACSPAPTAAPVYTIVPAEELAEELAEEPAVEAPQPLVVPKYYEVNTGDTLIAIAMHYELDYGEVARWNNLRDPNLIQPGQRLRLTPPPGDPVVTAVPKQQAPTLKPLGGISAPAAEDKTAALQPAVPAKPVERQSTIISDQAVASPAPAPGTAPYKTKPQAVKYAYSPGLLKKLENDWQQRGNVAKPGVNTLASNKPKPQTVAKPGVNTLAANKPKPAVLTATRQQHGIVWSLPSSGKVISSYSSRNKGADFAGKKGDPVYAAADGTVIYVGTGVKSYGRLVIVRHENNYLSAYAHNDSILVKEDQQITRGSKIATMGDSGSERVMLHFEVRKGGKPFDPAQVLPK